MEVLSEDLSKPSDMPRLDRAAGAKRKSRWNSGVCSLCGKWVECITQEHAKERGYKNADEMAKDGVVK